MATGTLNHLISSSPVEELTELTREQMQLADRLNRVAATRAQIESQLLVAGVPISVIDAAVQKGRE